MSKHRDHPEPTKSTSLRIMEHVVLGVCLTVLALRTTYTESPAARFSLSPESSTDVIYSLTLSGLLIGVLLLWLVWNVFSGRGKYRITGIEIGLAVLVLAMLISGAAANSKRFAVTHAVVLLAPILAAIALTQVLDSPSKIRLVLTVVAALGVVAAYQCAEQFFFSNPMMIEQYKKEPLSLLEPLGIEPNTYQHFLFEHRLYGQGVRGSFTTRNSAGCFLLMASCAAMLVAAPRLKRGTSDPQADKHRLFAGMAVGLVLFALALTRSKGATLGMLLAALLLTALLRFAKFIRAHRFAVITVLIVIAIGVGCIVIAYGLKHDRLPGGNPMLVRWQYWRASVRMIADFALTGVGPGNFAGVYPQYKPAAALESVADPHNFVLSLLTQYGPLGLAGFLLLVLIPLGRAMTPEPYEAPRLHETPALSGKTLTAYLLVLGGLLLVLRPLLMGGAPSGHADVLIYSLVTLYVAVAASFLLGFLLLAAPLTTDQTAFPTLSARTVSAALLCLVVGVLFQNLIDFALFEPGVWTTFWILIASLVAADAHRTMRPERALPSSAAARLTSIVLALLILAAYYAIAFKPVYDATTRIRKAHYAASIGRFDRAHNLLDQAADRDPLSTTALSLNARLYLQQYDEQPTKDRSLLDRAEACLLRAIASDPIGYKDREKLSTVYVYLGRFEEAFRWGEEATRRYPGCGRLWLNLGKLAEKLGQPDAASDFYRRAVDIEDAYRRQFKQMYPERDHVVSRIGEEQYTFAITRLRLLSP